MTDNEKKLEFKRIGLFILLAYLPNYLLEIIFSDKNGGMTSSFGAETLMYYPAIAAIITRIITKDKDELFLKANFKKNKGVYLFSAIFPMIGCLMTSMISSLIFEGDLHADIFDTQGVTPKLWSFTVIYYIFFTIPLLVKGFGEEYGWRAYLTPKLEKVMPAAFAPAVTGVIWAIWHAPMIWYGYDFGRDYPGFPYLGIAFMCIGCIPFSYALTWLTKKTSSVYPAVIAHMLLDTTNGVLTMLFIQSDTVEKNPLVFGLLLQSVPSVIALLCIGAVWLIKGKGSQQTNKLGCESI